MPYMGPDNPHGNKPKPKKGKKAMPKPKKGSDMRLPMLKGGY